MGKIELLAPAGNMECLKTAFYFGADAVYLGGKEFGLRGFAENFDFSEIKEAVVLAHAMQKKIYVAANAIMHEADLESLPAYFQKLQDCGVDAVIISDPGAAMLAKEAGLEVHLSTQASTSNAKSAQFWHQNGIKRIVLARELSLDEIGTIVQSAPETLEFEIFVHGAMCIAYSGRCLLSSVLTGRSGNQGKCAQPCRWEYTIHEAGYPHVYLPIQEDQRGTYLLNSKDLMMIEHLHAILQTGVASLKIEGRMKSAYYVGCVVNAYRRALDAALAGDPLNPELVQELQCSATRKFTTGFFFGNPGAQGQDVEKDLQPRNYIFCAVVREGRNAQGYLKIEQRNKFCLGDRLRVLSPHLPFLEFEVEELVNEEGMQQQSAPHAQQILFLKCPYDLQPGDMLRINPC